MDEEQKDVTKELTIEEYHRLYGKTPMEKMQEKRRKRIRITLLIILCICIGGIILYMYMLKDNEKTIQEISPEETEDYEGGSEQASLDYYIIDGVYVQKGLKDSYLKNKDVRGWIRIPDTPVDYPVLQSNAESPEFYLYKDIEKNYYIGGSIFADSNADTLKPSENVIIYGHHMSDGSGFKCLSKYEKESYYMGHKIIWYKTLNGNAKYEVVAAYRTSTHDSDFKFWNYSNMGKERFTEYMSASTERTPYKMEETAAYGDKLITLATCAYHTKSGRYVVVAKRVGFQEIDTAKKPLAVIKTNEDGTYTEIEQ